jgi:hypothetical protein
MLDFFTIRQFDLAQKKLPCQPLFLPNKIFRIFCPKSPLLPYSRSRSVLYTGQTRIKDWEKNLKKYIGSNATDKKEALLAKLKQISKAIR